MAPCEPLCPAGPCDPACPADPGIHQEKNGFNAKIAQKRCSANVQIDMYMHTHKVKEIVAPPENKQCLTTVTSCSI